MRAIFRPLIDDAAFRKLYAVILICTIPNFIVISMELFFVMMAVSIWIAQGLLGGDTRARITVFWIAVILFVPLQMQVAGFGGIRYFLELDHFNVPAIVLLIPASLNLLSNKSKGRPSTWPLDIAVVAYPLFKVAIVFSSVSLTASARSLIAMGLHVLIPYFVLTRGIRSWLDLKYLLVHFLGACLFAASVGLLEFAVQRNIYADIQWAYGTSWSLAHTLLRGDLIRVQAMTIQPIIYAAQLILTLGLWWAVGRPVQRSMALARLVDLGIICALIFTLSRGPWLGAVFFALTFFALLRLRAGLVAIGLLAIVTAGIAAKAAGLDASVMTFLKVVFGSTQEESGSIEYRSQLLDTAIALVKQSPWTGVPNYSAQMQDLVQGQGIIDVVNAYVGVALDGGLIGIMCFVAPFLVSFGMLFRNLGRFGSRLSLDELTYQRAILALLTGFMITIFTTSNWERLPFLLMFCISMPAILVGSSRIAAPQKDSPGGQYAGAPNGQPT
jgi:O-antigen ligase